MGRLGACNTCYRPDRKAIDDAHRAGAPTRDLARRFGIAESSLRKHFKHLRPAPKPEPLIQVIFRTEIDAIAAETGTPFADLVFHRLHCLRMNIAVTSAEGADELVDLMETFATPQEFQEMFGAAADRGAIYVPR